MVLERSPQRLIVTIDISHVVKGQVYALELLKSEREGRMNDQGLMMEHHTHPTRNI